MNSVTATKTDIALVLMVVTIALMVYLFATTDNQYVFIKDRPVPWESKRQSINYYAWRGPMFAEEFRNFEGANNPKDELVPTCHSCEIPKYNSAVPKSKSCHTAARNQCRVRTQTAEEGWRHEYSNSPYKIHGLFGADRKLGGPGNFAQVSNNNLDAPNNLTSVQMRSWMGDWFDDRDKTSPWCYTETYKQCMKGETLRA
jgi:hypothetical protein